jgi:hypothetical protein
VPVFVPMFLNPRLGADATVKAISDVIRTRP